MDITPDNWQRAKALFDAVLERPLTERTSFLESICPDEDLRKEVEQLLLNHEQADSFLSKPVIGRHNEFEARAALSLADSESASPIVRLGCSKSERFTSGSIVAAGFKIVDLLGEGGMGLVYRAEDVKLGRRVALKFLPEESAKDPAALARFEREAHAASALEHPNICPIYEFGEHEGQPFLVMQFLEGETLRELLEKRKLANQKLGLGTHRAQSSDRLGLPLEQLLNISIQVAAGLEAAHKKGIVHRDVKPANIFVTSEGQTKILDFGLAKLAGGATDEVSEPGRYTHDSSSERTIRTTGPLAMPDPFFSRTGVVMGTAGYMSPEQARGEKLDARTDVFSLGLVLYEMATGRRAFEGDTGPAILSAILTQTPIPVRQLSPKSPAKLEKIINKALEKHCDARYPNASEMRAELQALKSQIDSRHSRRRLIIAAAAIAIVLGSSSTYWFGRRQPPSSEDRPKIKLQQLTINSPENPVRSGAISPDGKYLAYVDTKGMHVKIMETGETHAVAQPELLKPSGVNWEIFANTWFPDSARFLANAHPASENPDTWSSRTSSIWMVSASGGTPLKLRDGALAWSVSPDGSLISFQHGDREIWLMGFAGEHPRKLYDAGERNAVCCLAFLRNEKRVLYIVTDQSGDTMVARDLQGGPLTTLLPSSELKKMGDGLWLPDGRIIYSIKEPQPVGDNCNYWTMGLDPRSGEVIQKPKQLTNWAGFCMNNPSATADGKRLAFLETSSGHTTTYLTDLEAGGKRIRNPRHFTFEETDDHIGDWTVDSKTLLLVYVRGHDYALYKQSLNSNTPKPILALAHGDLEIAILSPDGKWVIAMLYGGPSEPNQIVRVPFGGGSPEPIFKARYGSVISCAKAPSNLCAIAEQTEDRKEMIISAFDPVHGRGSELARFDADPNQDVSLYALLWSLSPDGTRLAAARNEQGPIQVRFLHDKATQVIRSKDLNRIRELHWTADGKGLFVTNLTRDGAELRHVDLEGNTELIWRSIGGVVGANPSPNGRYLAIDDPTTSANMWMMENF
jgi:serine/threonine protein kinase